ncbi:amidohydrolase family protein [Paenarthrobacter sp. NPDC089675]|uniref:amidohydrolase family protein n=1 Tax=Paenarthrobacter TaxID=1742992 RepID=UPI003824EE38
MASAIAITGATLIDGRGGIPIPNATVLIEGDRIGAVGSGDTVIIPAGATVIKATNAFIIPGIVNGNVHLLDGIMMMGAGGVEYLARYEGNFTGVIEEASQVALRNGVTTLFDTWNATGPVLAARDRIASGRTSGARMFAAGNIVGMGGPFTHDFNAGARAVISDTFAKRMDNMFEAGVGPGLSLKRPSDVRAIVRDYIARGVDMLKIAISDHLVTVTFSTMDRTYLTFSPRCLGVMADEARAAGIPLLTHTMGVEALELATDLGADVLVHASLTYQQPIPHDLVDKILKAGSTCGLQTVSDEYQNRLEAVNHPWAAYGGYVHAENERLLIKAGVPVMLGTDAGCTSHDVLTDSGEINDPHRPWSLGTDHVAWARGIVQKGMSEMNAISASTLNVARAYGKGDLIGSIEPGKLADLVILDADPLLDIGNMASVRTVFQNGRPIDRENLPLAPLVTGPSPTDPS